MARPQRLTAKKDWSVVFLAKYRQKGNVLRACEAAGITRQAAYARRDKDAAFASDWAAAAEDAADILEEQAWDRSGQSDTLTIFLLKGFKPDKYRERFSQEISGPAGGPVAIREVVVELPRGESGGESG